MALHLFRHDIHSFVASLLHWIQVLGLLLVAVYSKFREEEFAVQDPLGFT